MKRISVVIPAWNEAASVAAAVASVRAASEVIVVDCGSHDGTADRARRAGARVLTCPRGRGRQLARGARAASGEWLVFLHADTRLEPGWDAALDALPPGVVGGAFRFAVDAGAAPFRVLEAAVRLRTRLLALPYGDQALFARSDAYARVGGFRPLPLMEDVDFVGRLRGAGPLSFPAVRAVTSARRWQRRGLLATSLRNGGLLALYALGWPTERLARIYERRYA